MNPITTCPHCSARLNVSEQITDKTSICPHCHADMNSPGPGFQVQPADINTNVKGGLSVGSIVLAALIGLCILGITAAYFSTREGESGIVRDLNLAILFAALDILIGIAIIRGLVRWGFWGTRTSSAGRELAFLFLAFGTIVAAIIFFFFACSFLMRS